MNPLLKNARVIHVALACGVVMFAAAMVVFYVHGISPAASNGAFDQNSLSIFSWVHLLFFISTWTIGAIVAKKILADNPFTPALWFRARLVVLATREGSAFIGITACYMGIAGGILRDHPVYWLNLADSLLFVTYVARHFPTEADLGGPDSPVDPVTIIR